MKTLIIVQARMGSSRLPGKIMKKLYGEPMLSCVLKRLERCVTCDQIIVATTDQGRDDAVVGFCRERGIAVFRGSELDVLDRYYQAALAFTGETIVRVTSDCPLIDAAEVDSVVNKFKMLSGKADYVCNFLPKPSFPRGLETEVMSMKTLKKAWLEDDKPEWREHVTEYVLHHPDIFTIHGITNEIDYSHFRWTVDQKEDLELIQKIYDEVKGEYVGWHDVVDIFTKHPEWGDINKHVKQKVVL